MAGGLGAESDYVEYMRSHPRIVGRSSVVGRVALSGGVECIADMLEDKEFELPASVLARGRGVLGVPLLRDGKVEGAIVLTRMRRAFIRSARSISSRPLPIRP